MDSTAKPYAEIQTPEENHPALNAILGANPFVGLDATQVVGTLTMLMRNLAAQPTAVSSRASISCGGPSSWRIWSFVVTPRWMVPIFCSSSGWSR